MAASDSGHVILMGKHIKAAAGKQLGQDPAYELQTLARFTSVSSASVVVDSSLPRTPRNHKNILRYEMDTKVWPFVKLQTFAGLYDE